jgi:ribonuclease T2
MSLADKNGDWDRLPEPKLGDQTKQKLAQVMPGTQSNLERHEWIKRGTCFHADSADEYFSRAIALMDQLNAVEGARISFAETLVERVAYGFASDLTADVGGKHDNRARRRNRSLADLMAASAATDPGCPGGAVDTVGTH